MLFALALMMVGLMVFGFLDRARNVSSVDQPVEISTLR